MFFYLSFILYIYIDCGTLVVFDREREVRHRTSVLVRVLPADIYPGSTLRRTTLGMQPVACIPPHQRNRTDIIRDNHLLHVSPADLSNRYDLLTSCAGVDSDTTILRGTYGFSSGTCVPYIWCRLLLLPT